MIEFLKERKIIVVITILALIIIGWKTFESININPIQTEEIVETKEAKQEENEEQDEIVIHVTGEVKKPGIVKTKEGSRIEDIINLAGGLTQNADITDVNLAYVVEDGTKIKIPSKGEKNKESEDEFITERSGKGVIESEESKKADTKININTAEKTELENLPGIGPSISEKIIEFREQNGKFKNKEDIKKVTGIGENKYAKIKEYIRVK